MHPLHKKLVTTLDTTDFNRIVREKRYTGKSTTIALQLLATAISNPGVKCEYGRLIENSLLSLEIK